MKNNDGVYLPYDNVKNNPTYLSLITTIAITIHRMVKMSCTAQLKLLKSELSRPFKGYPFPEASPSMKPVPPSKQFDYNLNLNRSDLKFYKQWNIL